MRLNTDPNLPANPPDGYLTALRYRLDKLMKDVIQQLNGVTEGSVVAISNAYTTYPTMGSWKQGDFIRNSAPSELGGGGSKYVITGWMRVTSGSANVLNTDWVECHSLTGN